MGNTKHLTPSLLLFHIILALVSNNNQHCWTSLKSLTDKFSSWLDLPESETARCLFRCKWWTAIFASGWSVECRSSLLQFFKSPGTCLAQSQPLLFNCGIPACTSIFLEIAVAITFTGLLLALFTCPTPHYTGTPKIGVSPIFPHVIENWQCLLTSKHLSLSLPLPSFLEGQAFPIAFSSFSPISLENVYLDSLNLPSYFQRWLFSML